MDDVVLNASALSIAEWVALQGRVRSGLSSVILPFCHCRGYLSVSSRQTQFFRHYANQADCDFATAGESDEHLFAKREIVAGVRDAGWSAHVEASSRRNLSQRRRADVLAMNGSSQTALEVQRSHQPTDECLARSARYRESGGGCLWFTYGDKVGHARLRHLDSQVFLVEIGFDAATVIQLGDDGAQSVPLRNFVTNWLGGRRPKLPRVVDLAETQAPQGNPDQSNFRHLPAIGEPELRNGKLEVAPTRTCA